MVAFDEGFDGLLSANRRASAAADLSALAAADAYRGLTEGDPCAVAADAPRDMLIGPMWSLNKWEVLNSIEAEMRRRGSVQGCKAVKQEFMNEKTT